MHYARVFFCTMLMAGCGGQFGDSTGATGQADTDPTCGNGVREPGEQCDDGNTTNLDGCDATCRFEQVQRVNQLTMQFGTSASCAHNAIGGAVTTVAHSNAQSSLDKSVQTGAVSVMTQLIGLDNLTSADATSVTVGVLNGTPMATAGYDGSHDPDGWYAVDEAGLDADRQPTALLSASITSGVLTAGPGSFTARLAFAGSIGQLELRDATLRMPLGAATAPAMSSNDSSPGHVAAEQLDPALTSYASSGGELCGNITAASLAKTPMPQMLLSYCGSYNNTNSLLDLLVTGCKVLGFLTAVSATQPDTIDASAPGTGTKYKLKADSGKHVVSCTNQTGAAVALDECLGRAAYSSFYTFTTERVIVKP